MLAPLRKRPLWALILWVLFLFDELYQLIKRLSGENCDQRYCEIASELFHLQFDYQSECHCSKTGFAHLLEVFLFDYQSECHCSKTLGCRAWSWSRFDYQSECHCSKTLYPFSFILWEFDYQSECHCSKTQPLFVSFLFVRKEALEELVFF